MVRDIITDLSSNSMYDVMYQYNTVFDLGMTADNI